ncbi:hypothetical protein, conserved [Eimeria tenella]|uniref:Uncharacterized protein n=1 Tax=Eimeria tenella TaxID=5802 RepID=U6KVV6_EIMTE|nr:hypothetical protein, conserved [Eimeria tenella]CDJ40469.1 hypothetical protein, conserved [Eimeria tenella]|eukprot:XP_013231219.1 hypothetical protein, conserved [Eimeria tenella]
MADQKADKAKKHMKCGRSSCPQDRGRDELRRGESSKGCPPGVHTLHGCKCTAQSLVFFGRPAFLGPLKRIYRAAYSPQVTAEDPMGQETLRKYDTIADSTKEAAQRQ